MKRQIKYHGHTYQLAAGATSYEVLNHMQQQADVRKLAKEFGQVMFTHESRKRLKVTLKLEIPAEVTLYGDIDDDGKPLAAVTGAYDAEKEYARDAIRPAIFDNAEVKQARVEIEKNVTAVYRKMQQIAKKYGVRPRDVKMALQSLITRQYSK